MSNDELATLIFELLNGQTMADYTRLAKLNEQVQHLGRHAECELTYRDSSIQGSPCTITIKDDANWETTIIIKTTKKGNNNAV